MPFRYTYQPLMHYTVAAVSALAGFSTPRAFHIVLALAYSAGPLTLFFLTKRLSKSYRTALIASLVYSLCSPSAWLMPDVAHDIGGLLLAQRLHAAVSYGDAPHIFGLTLIPLALLLIDRALERPSLGRVLLASLACIAVPLINIPAAIALGMALVAYCLAASGNLPGKRAAQITGIALLGYILVAPAMPPSGLLLTARNTQWMQPTEAMTPVKSLAIAIGFVCLAIVSRFLLSLTNSFFTRFSVLFLLITGIVVLGNDWGGFSVIAQPKRFHLALEIAVACCIASFACVVNLRDMKLRAAAFALVSILVFWQIKEYRLYARKLIRPSVLTDTSELKIAEWFRLHAGGSRVFVPGSVSFFLNVFTPTPQSDGCCDQNRLFAGPGLTKYLVGTDDGAGSQAGEFSIVWLKTLGVKYIAVCGPRSTEAFHAIHHPHKFDGLLLPRWREGDDAIFELTGPASSSLAHWIRPSGVISRMPVNAVDVDPLRNYIASLESADFQTAGFNWVDTDKASIQGQASPNQLLSIQIPFHAGWHATDSRRPVRFRFGRTHSVSFFWSLTALALAP